MKLARCWELLRIATTFFHHLEMASYLEFGKIYCVSVVKEILCTICCFSSLLCQETDEGSDIALSVFWDSLVVKTYNAQ